jgi:hypothetical protein
MFVDHAVVKIAGITIFNAIYDPSYGQFKTGTTMEAAEAAWEDAYIDSYSFLVMDNQTGIMTWTDWFSNVVGVDELDFTP